MKTLDDYIGIEHDPDAYDCADLTMDVARDLFGREIVLPSVRARPKGCATQAAALGTAIEELAVRVDAPRDGDLVLMINRGQERAGHVGTYFFRASEAYVLHTAVRFGCSCIHSLRELPRLGIRVEGIYRWK